MSRRRVRVHALTIALGPDEKPSEWFACCTEADWSQGGVSCNWYGEYRDNPAHAKSDAARHRRTHTA